MSVPTGDIDFFISYRGACTPWARWVNWVVRSAGFSTILMDEFQTGMTWTDSMRQAAQRSRRLIPLYSQDYWSSGACVEEFDAYWRQHLANRGERFLLPLEVEACVVPDMHKMLLWKSIHKLSRDEAHAAIVKVLAGIVPATALGAFMDTQPAFPGVAAAPAAMLEWPDAVPGLKWPLADHDDARTAFAELVTRGTGFKLLAVKGSSETGKSHLTQQFLTNAQRRVPGCRCARFDFKGTAKSEEALKDFAQHLQVPPPTAGGTLADGFRQMMQGLVKHPQPTLLIFDTYEQAGETDKWVQDNLLTSLHQQPWLRVVIAGQTVPPCGGRSWHEDAKVLLLLPPEPHHWATYAVANQKNVTSETLTEVHRLTGGKASIMALLCGPDH